MREENLDLITTPLAIADFRRFWMARFMSVFATISMVVLIGYQTYDVARADYGMDRPEAAFQLGLLGLVQFIPIFLLTPIAGIAADRFDRRMVVMAANLTDSCIAVTLAVFTYQDALTLPILFSLAALHGTARVFNGPALSAIIPNLVPPRLLPRGIALGYISWQMGTIIGPAFGGILFESSPSMPHFISAGLLVMSAGLIMTIRPIRAKQEGPPVHPFRQIILGFQFVTGQRFLLGCITLDLFAVLLAGATALLPIYARDILNVGADGLGFMRGAMAAGAAPMALFLSFKPIENNVGAKMLWSVAIFGAGTIAFGLSRDFYLSLALLTLLGATDMISMFIRSSLVQLNTPDTMRGRVSSISGLAISASNELGEMQSGIAAALLGATGAVVFGGAGAIFVTIAWAFLFPEIRKAKTFSSKYLDDPPSGNSPEDPLTDATREKTL